jgi:glutaredoxin
MAAREDFGQRGYAVQYFDVKKNADKLEEMLGYSSGQRRVPTIVENGKVTIGFGGT